VPPEPGALAGAAEAVIPDGGGGRVGVISGNEFTPLPLSGAASTPMQSGTW